MASALVSGFWEGPLSQILAGAILGLVIAYFGHVPEWGYVVDAVAWLAVWWVLWGMFDPSEMYDPDEGVIH